MIRVRFAGRGGQGIILAGIVVATSASEKYHVLQTQSYGAEARLGACKADVVISENPIFEINVSEVDYLLCLSKQSFEKYKATCRGLTVVDSTISEKNSIPAIKTSLKEFKTPLFANMIMVGFLNSYLSLSIEKTLKKIFNGNVLEKNLLALKIGERIKI